MRLGPVTFVGGAAVPWPGWYAEFTKAMAIVSLRTANCPAAPANTPIRLMALPERLGSTEDTTFRDVRRHSSSDFRRDSGSATFAADRHADVRHGRA